MGSARRASALARRVDVKGLQRPCEALVASTTRNLGASSSTCDHRGTSSAPIHWASSGNSAASDAIAGQASQAPANGRAPWPRRPAS